MFISDGIYTCKGGGGQIRTGSATSEQGKAPKYERFSSCIVNMMESQTRIWPTSARGTTRAESDGLGIRRET